MYFLFVFLSCAETGEFFILYVFFLRLRFSSIYLVFDINYTALRLQL